MNFRKIFHFFLICFLFVEMPFCGNTQKSWGLDNLEFHHSNKVCHESGRIVLEAEDGIAFEARDGRFYVVPPDQILKRTTDQTPFSYYSLTEIKDRIRLEFPESEGFEILDQEPFLVVYTTSRSFALWYSQLLKKLYEGYHSYWKGRGILLHKPDYPLVAIVLSNRSAFMQYAKTEGFQLGAKEFAYYNPATNRIVMCDLSGAETMREGAKDRSSSRVIQMFVNHPDARKNIATVVHEATHQVGFSCGVHPRFTPNPLWLCEGIAMFHEVPDTGKQAGWSAKIKLSPHRLNDLRRTGTNFSPEYLRSLISNDDSFRNPATAIDSYAFSWGLFYYLAMKRPKDLAAYILKMQQKTILSQDSPDIRLRDFESCFGENWDKIYRDCTDYLRGL
ncbi:MAG: DUF1570 domain-containing protein [Thermoguttaceae bacterium]